MSSEACIPPWLLLPALTHIPLSMLSVHSILLLLALWRNIPFWVKPHWNVRLLVGETSKKLKIWRRHKQKKEIIFLFTPEISQTIPGQWYKVGDKSLLLSQAELGTSEKKQNVRNCDLRSQQEFYERLHKIHRNNKSPGRNATLYIIQTKKNQLHC